MRTARDRSAGPGRLVAAGARRRDAASRSCALGRPGLDLADPAGVADALRRPRRRRRRQRRRLYGGRQGRERGGAGDAHQWRGRRRWSREAARAARRAGASSSRPIMCSTARSTGPIARTIRRRPIGAYGRSKLAGEAGGRRTQSALRASCAPPGSTAPFGANFVKTMLRLGETRERGLRSSPTSAAPDQRARHRRRADSPSRATARGTEPTPAMYGVFHMTGRRRGDLGGFRRSDLRRRRDAHGRPPVTRDAASRPPIIRRRRAGPPIRGSTARKLARDLRRGAAALARLRSQPVVARLLASQNIGLPMRASFSPAAAARGCIR